MNFAYFAFIAPVCAPLAVIGFSPVVMKLVGATALI
jgi:hypothetical protein